MKEKGEESGERGRGGRRERGGEKEGRERKMDRGKEKREIIEEGGKETEQG